MKSYFDDWDQFYMNMVYLIALKSKDESTKQGAVIVSPFNRVKSIGYNGLPRNVNDNIPERDERPKKYLYYEHAERNAIFNAETSLLGSTLYTNGCPCPRCARAIIQVGIIRVIYDKEWYEKDMEILKKYPDSWESGIFDSLEMFHEAGIVLKGIKVEKFIVPRRFRRGEVF
jgi:dCMP deaminase